MVASAGRGPRNDGTAKASRHVPLFFLLFARLTLAFCSKVQSLDLCCARGLVNCIVPGSYKQGRTRRRRPLSSTTDNDNDNNNNNNAAVDATTTIRWGTLWGWPTEQAAVAAKSCVGVSCIACRACCRGLAGRPASLSHYVGMFLRRRLYVPSSSSSPQ